MSNQYKNLQSKENEYVIQTKPLDKVIFRVQNGQLVVDSMEKWFSYIFPIFQMQMKDAIYFTFQYKNKFGRYVIAEKQKEKDVKQIESIFKSATPINSAFYGNNEIAYIKITPKKQTFCMNGLVAVFNCDMTTRIKNKTFLFGGYEKKFNGFILRIDRSGNITGYSEYIRRTNRAFLPSC
jgi:hypothetical protein